MGIFNAFRIFWKYYQISKKKTPTITALPNSIISNIKIYESLKNNRLILHKEYKLKSYICEFPIEHLLND